MSRRMSALILAGGCGIASLVAADDKLLFGDIPDWCGYMSPEDWQGELWAAVARGEIENPVTKDRPPARPPNPLEPGNPSCVTPAQFFAYEDTDGVLSRNFSNGEMFALMIDAANELLAEHGDNYDFVGYWTNFDPHHLIGAAFYAGFENDVRGIGQGLFNHRGANGLNGDNIEGFIMMWNLNTSWWAPGDGPNANFTRLALAQEFEHRFAMFLPPLANGLVLQGNNGSCGRGAHWNFRVDGQGSGMEIGEWVGENPAVWNGDSIDFNTDILGGVWSYTDLYLMGYVSPLEMDAGNSELRYMVDSQCAIQHFGEIADFTSADIIATAGGRIPDSTTAQKHFRTAWIVIHQPGDEPSQTELQRTSAILNQHTIDWDRSTLGFGTIDNTIFDDQNCDGLPDCQADIDGDGDIDADDFFAYLDAFAAGDLGVCDIDGDGDCDGDDFFGYLDRFAQGCE